MKLEAGRGKGDDGEGFRPELPHGRSDLALIKEMLSGIMAGGAQDAEGAAWWTCN